MCIHLHIMKDPPDKFKCIKLQLKDILKNTEDKKIIFSSVVRTNKIIIKAYLLLKLWILDKYHNTDSIPFIDQNTILACINSIKIKSSANTDKAKLLLEEFKSLYTFEKEDGSYLTQVLVYKSVTMLTMIENNIKNNFFDYIRRYINIYFLNKKII